MPRHTKWEHIKNLSDDEILKLYTHAQLQEIIEDHNKIIQEGRAQAELAPEDGLRTSGRPGFLNRLGASFGSTPEDEVDILRKQGIAAFIRDGVVMVNTDQGPVRADPEGLDWGDVADVGGEIPSIAGGVLGGLGGALIPIPGASPALAATGSGVGDWARQQIAQELGAKRPTDWGQVGMEVLLGAGGEVAGKGVARVAKGLFKKKTPDVENMMEEVVKFDKAHGTDLAGKAPIDVMAGGGDFLGHLTQRVRESPLGGEAIRKHQDIPFEREVEAGFDAVRRGAVGRSGADPVGKRQAGVDIGGAIRTTLEARRGQEGRLHETLRSMVDLEAQPATENTRRVIVEIRNSPIFKQGVTGSQGRDILDQALMEAEELVTYDKLMAHRQGVGTEIKWAQLEPGRMAPGMPAQLRKLWGALKDDEAAFLEAGGHRSTGAVDVVPPTPVIDITTEGLQDAVDVVPPTPVIDITTKGLQALPKGPERTPNQIVKALGGLRPSELNRIRGAADLEKGTSSQVGRLKGRNGLTIEEMLEEVNGSEELRSVFAQAGIDDPRTFFEAIRTGSFFQKFPTGAQAAEEGAARAQVELARSRLGNLFGEIDATESLDALEGVVGRIHEGRRAGVLDVDDLEAFQGAVSEQGQRLKERLIQEGREHTAFARRDLGGNLFGEIDATESLDALEGVVGRIHEGRRAGVLDVDDLKALQGAVQEQGQRLKERLISPDIGVPDIGQADQAAAEAARRANLFSTELHGLDEASIQRIFGDQLTLSEIPNRLRSMNADQIRAVREVVGEKGTGAGLTATAKGSQAWDQIAAEVLVDLKIASRAAPKGRRPPEHFALSGKTLKGHLDKFKPGALEEIFGPEATKDIRNFATLAMDMDVSERAFGARMATSAFTNPLAELYTFFTHPIATSGRMAARYLAEMGMGRMLGSQSSKRFLTGQTAFQQRVPSRLLDVLGRVGGQETSRQLPGLLGAERGPR